MVTFTLLKVRPYHNGTSLSLLFLAFGFSLWTLLVFKLKRQIKILMRRRRKSSAYDVPSLDIKGKLILLPEEGDQATWPKVGFAYLSLWCTFQIYSQLHPRFVLTRSGTKTWPYHLLNGLATPNIGSSLFFSLGRRVSKEGARQLLIHQVQIRRNIFNNIA